MKKIDIPDRPWQDMGIIQPQIIREFRGINTLDRYSIDKSFGTYTRNLTGAGFPGLSVRPGYSQMSGALPGAVQGMGLYKDTELHVIGGGRWYRWNGSSWDQLYSGLSTTAQAYFCNFQGNLSSMSLLMTNGIVALYYDGSSVKTLSNVPSGATFIDQHDNRVYAAKGNNVHFSALRKPQDWTTVDEAGEIVIETNNGEEITGIKAGNRHLMVFKKSSFHELWGTNPANYQMNTITQDIGALSNQAITTIQGVPFWIDNRGIYTYGGNTPRKDFSLPVKDYIDKLNLANAHKAAAGTNGKSLYVSIPCGSSSEPNTVLEYDLDFQTWYVWNDMTPLHFSNSDTDFFMGDQNGRICKFGGTTDNGNPINWEWQSAPFGGGSQAQKLRWYRMWYVADIPSGSYVDVYLSKKAEGEDWIHVKRVEATGGSMASGRIIIPIESVANSNWVRVRFTGRGPSRVIELDYQQRALPLA